MKKPEYVIKNNNYEGCISDFNSGRVVLVGAGFDGTSSYRSGSRFAPIALRSETVLAQENYSPYFRRDLTELSVHDLGDVDIAFGNKERTLSRIETVSQYLVDNLKIPFFIGGEHLITLPIVKPLLKKFPDLHVLQIDAHLDFMDELFGDRYSHGTVMRRIAELLVEKDRIFQVGIRSGSREEYQYAEKHTRLFQFEIDTFLDHISELKNKPVYLSVDLDVFDPSLIPGTGTPEAGGIFFQDFIRLLKSIKDINIVGADMVELTPKLDPTDVSTIVASKIMREIIMIL